MSLERRSGADRRQMPRHKVKIEIEWEGLVGRKTGTISDISETGCFVMSSGEVMDNETVKIFFPLTGGMKVQFMGVVTNHYLQIGFAIQFIDLSEAQVDFLEKFVDTLEK
jgi:hypothetical protein